MGLDRRTAAFSRWSVQNASDEPSHGYYARLVAAEGHLSVVKYSEGIGVNARYMDPEGLLTILMTLPLSDERRERLRNATPVWDGAHYRLAGQRFNNKDMSFLSRRWCPGCLNESAHHRAWWDIQAISECPHHKHPIMDRDDHGNAVRWWWPVMDSSPKGDLLAKPMPRDVGPNSFAAYIIGRLGFGTPFSSDLLDEHDICDVIQVSEMVGTLLSSPSSETAPKHSPEMTEVGFQAMSGDAANLVEYLRAWVRANVPTETRTRGYAFAFGWVNRHREHLDSKKLRDVLLVSFRRALALESRQSSESSVSADFTEKLISRTVLANRLGVGKNAVATVADALGFLPKGTEYRTLVQFDPAEADAIERHFQQMPGRIEVGRALGLTSREIKPLVKAGLLREFSSASAKGQGGYRIVRSDVESLLKRLETLRNDGSDGPSVSFQQFAKNTGRSKGELALSVVEGRHHVVRAKSRMPGFKGLKVICKADQTSRKPLRVLQRPSDVVSLVGARIELNVSQRILPRLIDAGVLVRVDDSKAGKSLTRGSVARFAAEYRNANQVLAVTGMTVSGLIDVMTAHGRVSVLSPHFKTADSSMVVFYRYDDLAQVFGFTSDPTRFDDAALESFWSKARPMASTLPPYLHLPSRLPVGGQLVFTSTKKAAFFVNYDPATRVVCFEGRRGAAALGTLEFSVDDQDRSLARLEEVLVSLVEKTPRRLDRASP
jgi:hypothetical protein